MVIFGKKIKLKFVKNLTAEQGFLGLYFPARAEIQVDKEAHKTVDELNHTILHEALHALFHRVGFKQAIDPKTEEIMVENISTMLVENFNLKIKE